MEIKKQETFYEDPYDEADDKDKADNKDKADDKDSDVDDYWDGGVSTSLVEGSSNSRGGKPIILREAHLAPSLLPDRPVRPCV